MASKQISCPVCKTTMVTDLMKHLWFLCPTCNDIYFMSRSGLEKRKVAQATDLTQYPEIVIEANPPFCDCQIREYLETLMCTTGPHYCQIHNIIALAGIYDQKDKQKIDQEIVYILVHETIHWLLGKFVSESTSYSLDSDTVSEFLERYCR